MAFLFNGASNDDQDNGKQNIFGADTSAQVQSDGTAGGVVQKTTLDGGNVSRGTSTTSAPNTGGSATPAAPGGYNPKAVSSAYSSIAQNLRLPSQSIQKAQSSISSGEQKLQDEANKYGQQAQTTAKGYDLDQTTLDQAAIGNNDAYQKTAQRLQSAAPEFESFKGLGSDLPNVDNIRDSSKAYAAEAGPNYTAGQSRYDQALLKRNPAYVQMQAEILGKSSALKKQSDDMAASETDRQRAMLADSYKTSTDQIRSNLGGMSNAVVQAAKDKSGQEDLRRQSLDPVAIANKEAQSLKAKVQADLAQADPRSAQYRSLKFLADLPAAELSKYVNVDRSTDWHEFVGQGDADRYNRVEGLLGNSNMLTPTSGGPGKDYEFDQKGAYGDLIGQLTGKRQQADQQAQTELDAIRAAAEARAAGSNKLDLSRDARTSAEQELLGYAREQALKKYGNDPRYQDLATLHTQDLFEGQNLENLKAKGLLRDNAGTASWQDVLTGDEQARANALSEEMGGLDRYSGGYKGEYNIDDLKAYYDQYSDPYFQKYQSDFTPPPAPTPQGSTIGKKSQAKSNQKNVK